MKKFLLLITLLISAFGLISADDENPAKKEKMFREVQEFKMRYLAQEMDLNEVQKKKFFELYEEMNESKKECYQEALVLNRRLKEDKNATEEDYQQGRNAMNEANAKWAEIEKQYDDKFAEFLSQKQLYQMKEAETNFRTKFEEMKVNRRKAHRQKTDSKK